MGAAAPRAAAPLARRAAGRRRARACRCRATSAPPRTSLVRELAADPRWACTLRGDGAVAEPAEYAALLAATGADVDVWETTYLHRLTGPDPVLEWIGSTALRPVRDALEPHRRPYAAFRAELAPRLRAAYPAQPDGTTWFPFRRIFAVARAR